jgi:teichuronic acid biosynthesis glycosyltransferase TuaC
VDPEFFSPGNESSASGPIVLSVGNLIPIKGHEFVIRAVASLRTEFPSLTLEIIGEGGEHARLEGLARELKIAEHVRFFGRQSRSQVADAMRCCTVFAQPI